MPRRALATRWLPLLTALALLCAQHLALAHALSHHSNATLSQGAGDKHPPQADGACLQCLVMAQVAGGPAASAPELPDCGAAFGGFASDSGFAAEHECGAYRARAPPDSLR
jgi:hypothetical protein